MEIYFRGRLIRPLDSPFGDGAIGRHWVFMEDGQPPFFTSEDAGWPPLLRVIEGGRKKKKGG